ncbi:olfactory receptor 13H1 [Alligator mississippiensis]|uniref:olfactory receptor 13H1 n=1 Tax=Alligator mississippiensis TaxID=8496 RepID=UPI0003D0D684|nr:olfactory receptor 13H1 [Alligator mississippiensis]
MGMDNESVVTEFIFVGMPDALWVKIMLFIVLFIIYLGTLIGNIFLIVLTRVDIKLHTPMYFFLSNLSFLDVCYTTSTLPQLMAHSLSNRPSISLSRCFAQMYISLFLGMTECLLLSVMAYDRWVAVCNPLRYALIMNHKVCIYLAAMSWSGAFIQCLLHPITMKVQFCGHIIKNFSCELSVVLSLVCSDTRDHQIVLLSTNILSLLLPFTFILVTYTHIIVAVLSIRSAKGRSKAFSTCTSHLIVVTIFYGTCIFMYLRPKSQSFPDQDKYISLFYGAITPMLNPIVYSLRNKDVKGALRKFTGGKMNS